MGSWKARVAVVTLVLDLRFYTKLNEDVLHFAHLVSSSFQHSLLPSPVGGGKRADRGSIWGSGERNFQWRSHHPSSRNNHGTNFLWRPAESVELDFQFPDNFNYDPNNHHNCNNYYNSNNNHYNHNSYNNDYSMWWIIWLRLTLST